MDLRYITTQEEKNSSNREDQKATGSRQYAQPKPKEQSVPERQSFQTSPLQNPRGQRLQPLRSQNGLQGAQQAYRVLQSTQLLNSSQRLLQSTINVHTLSLQSFEEKRLKKKRKRPTYPKEVIVKLEDAFSLDNYASRETKIRLAEKCGLEYRKVDKWFDNRRSKKRKELMIPKQPALRSTMPEIMRTNLSPSEPLLLPGEETYKFQLLNSVNPADLKSNMTNELNSWLDFVRERKNFLKETNFPAFEAEVKRLFNSLSYEGKMIATQGDRILMNADISITCFTFTLKPEEKDPANTNKAPPAVLRLRYLFESRWIKRSKSDQLLITKSCFAYQDPNTTKNTSMVTTHPYSIGLKATGTYQSLRYLDCSHPSDQFVAWGDTSRLAKILKTEINMKELFSFLLFVVGEDAVKSKWFLKCACSMFGDSENFYFPQGEKLGSTV